MTNAEVASANALEALEARRTRWETLYKARYSELEAAAFDAQSSAATGSGRLLTGRDEDLVLAVADALRKFGLIVASEDEERVAVGRGKAHDLNVADPDSSERKVIVEVKGYGKGARGALAQANQHILRFTIANGGRPPDACWLIVNHFRDHDPDERPQLLQGADDDITLFAENGGVLIDTRDLFKFVQKVERGELSTSSVRRALAAATGRLLEAQVAPD